MRCICSPPLRLKLIVAIASPSLLLIFVRCFYFDDGSGEYVIKHLHIHRSNWTILFNNSVQKGSTAYDLYNVKGLPAFFFINSYGNLAQSPAQSPTQGFEYKLKALFKPKKKDTKIGIR